MCGINGFNFADKELIQTMNQATRHRGPDGADFYADDAVTIGHNLLAITDTPTNTHQPVTDGTHVLTYNGEIYNYRNLRRELESQGDQFTTDSDTEVIFKGIVRHGESFISRLNGMFAIGFYDKNRRRIILARDMMGMKPLYYHWQNAKLLFSSELRGVLVHDIPRKLDREAMDIFFALGYVPGARTLIQNIHKVCPGQYLVCDLEKKTLTPHWFTKPRDNVKQTFDPAHFRELIGNSTEAHTMGLRPFGLYLSGGLDSTLLLHELATRRKDKIKTYATRFDVPKEAGDYNEDADAAMQLCSDYAIEHHELLVTDRSYTYAYESAIATIEEPRYNVSVPAYMLLAERASKDIVVVLNGSGGDELFGGYIRHGESHRIQERYDSYPRFLLDLYYGAHLKNPLDRWLHLNQIKKNHSVLNYLENIGSPTIERPMNDTENAITELDRYLWLADEEFIRTDKLVMHYGMEGRFPFLDRTVVDYAYQISGKDKVVPNTKQLVRQAYQGILPDYVINKQKTGWNAPATRWMKGEFGTFVRSVLSRDYYAETSGLFDFDAITRQHIDGVTHFTNATIKHFMPIVAFQVWARASQIQL